MSSSSLSSLSSSTEILMLSSSSSSSSTEVKTTSSSSFGDAIQLFYFLDRKGDLFSLRADSGRAQSSLVFKSFSQIVNQPMALAISSYAINDSSSSSAMLTTSSSSLSSESSFSESSGVIAPNSSSSLSSQSSTSESSSLSSQSGLGLEYNVFILRKRDSRTCNLAIHNMTGYLKGSIDFSSSITFLGMSAWPDENNLLVATSENLIHFLYIASGQIGISSIECPINLTYGLALKDRVDENVSRFFVRNRDKKEIVLLSISKKTKTVSIVSRYPLLLSKWQRTGGISCEFGTYGLGATVYTVMEEENGYSHVSSTVILS